MTKYFISIALSLFCLAVFAQSTDLLTEGVDKTISIAAQNSNSSATDLQMLTLVAKAKAMPVNALTLEYAVKEHRKVTKTGNRLQLYLSVGNFVFSDEISYLKFPIATFLKPSLITFTYVWEDANAKIIQQKTVKNLPFKNGAYIVKLSEEDVYQSASYKLYLSDVSFSFDAQDVKKLDEFMTKVDAYYNADAQLNMLEKGLDAIRVDSIELLETARQQTIDNTKTFNHIKSQRFASNLDLDANDPIQFKSHLGQVEVKNKAVKKNVEFALDNMHITYYLKGNDYLKWGNPEMAKALYLKSIHEKADYASPYVGLAQFDFNSKNYKAALDTCKKVLVQLKPDNDSRYQAVKIAEAVIYVYLDEIKQQIENKEFELALERFEQVKTESKGIPGVKTFTEFNDVQTLLYKGYYNQMVELATEALQQKNFLAAHQKIDSLADFRQQHSSIIMNPSQEHILLKNLYAKWVEQGRAQVANNYPDSALFSYMQAKLLCKRYEVVYCTEALENEIFEAVKMQYIQYCNKAEVAIQEQLADSALTLLALAKRLNREFTLTKYDKYDSLLIEASQLKYTELIQEGDAAFSKNQMREAMAFYQEALEMEKQVKLKVDESLPGKIRDLAKNNVLLYCLQVESLVEAMNLPDASSKLNDARTLTTTYKLETDHEVSDALSKVTALFNQGKCNQALFEYNVQLTASKKFIEKHEFIYAAQSLDKANLLVKQYPECQLDASVYSAMYNEIRAMLHYQKQMIQIDTYIDDKEYSDAVEAYNQLTKFYIDSCTNNFGIEHKKLDDYFMTHANTQFVDFGIRYYVELGKIAFAMDLLHELHRQDYISGWSRASQEALGEQLALLDMEKNPEQDPKIKVIDYTQNDKWYRFLRKSYLQQWKNR